jgi:hypothetical protein
LYAVSLQDSNTAFLPPCFINPVARRLPILDILFVPYQLMSETVKFILSIFHSSSIINSVVSPASNML